MTVLWHQIGSLIDWAGRLIDVAAYLWLVLHLVVWRMGKNGFAERHPTAFKRLDNFTIRFGNIESKL
jgi:hypothetical protein